VKDLVVHSIKKARFFAPLRMTEEGIRMIYLNIRMTVAKGSERYAVGCHPE
jgi:hypothetical protein